MKLTDQQKTIIDAVNSPNKIIKIEALAGTGKTTTLIEIAKHYKNKKILFFAFNNSVAKELQSKLNKAKLKNAKAITLHAFAYRYLLGVSEQDRLNLVNKSVIIDKLIKKYDIDYISAMLVYDTFESICNSNIELKDLKGQNAVKFFRKYTLTIDRNLTAKYIALNIIDKDNEISQLIDMALRLYKLMERRVFPINHSFYLKYTAENLESQKYDIILVDEAQDINAVQLQLLSRFETDKIILVGDNHQSIYGWRGAVNSLRSIKNAEVYPLTHCFRFAAKSKQEKYANRILRVYKAEDKQLQGVADIADDNNYETEAHLFRTNAELILFLLKQYEKFKLMRKLDDILSELDVAQALLEIVNRGYSNRYAPYYLKQLAMQCSGINQLYQLISSLDYSLARTISILLKFNLTPNELRRLLEDKITTKNHNKYALTVHTAKGLEFDLVNIHSDFLGMEFLFEHFLTKKRKYTADKLADEHLLKREFNIFITGIRKGKISYKMYEEEINLIYIAVTRARKRIKFINDEGTNQALELILFDDEAKNELINSLYNKFKKEAIQVRS